MATGAASQLAGVCGMPAAVAPLLWLSVAQAAWIAGRAAVRCRARALVLPRPALTEPGEWAGLLTVPLGLAVATAGLATQHEALASALAPAGLGVTWLATAVILAGFFASAAAGERGFAALDGSWFLAPAALLGGSAAAVACIPHAPEYHGLLRGLAVAAAAGGLAGYWVVLAAAAARIGRHGLGAPKVLWWISAGCGGLAAASTLKVLGAGDGRWPSALAAAMRAAAAVTWVAAVIVLVPVAVWSIRFLAGKRPVSRPVPWPPAFSAGVIALGTVGVGAALRLPVVTMAGKAAGIAALTLWAVTMSWYAAVLGRRFRGGRLPNESLSPQARRAPR